MGKRQQSQNTKQTTTWQKRVWHFPFFSPEI